MAEGVPLLLPWMVGVVVLVGLAVAVAEGLTVPAEPEGECRPAIGLWSPDEIAWNVQNAASPWRMLEMG